MIWNDRIRELREKSRLTLKEIAKKLGVTEATAQRYESSNGIKQIPYEIVEEYAKIFGVTPSYIMGWEDKPKENKAYYADEDTARIAQEIFDDPDLHALFDAAQDSQPNDLSMAADLLKRLKQTNK